MINTSALDKIHNRYNPEHDLGPDAPVSWATEDLAWLLGKAIEHIEALEERLVQLDGRLPDEPMTKQR